MPGPGSRTGPGRTVATSFQCPKMDGKMLSFCWYMTRRQVRLFSRNDSKTIVTKVEVRLRIARPCVEAMHLLHLHARTQICGSKEHTTHLPIIKHWTDTTGQGMTPRQNIHIVLLRLRRVRPLANCLLLAYIDRRIRDVWRSGGFHD
jgi:hypothetical protein